MWLPLTSTFFLLRFVSSENETDQERLVNTLFKSYNRDLRPVANTANVTNVTLNPALFSIIQTDEAAESITVLLWLRMIWTDIFIRWNPSDYGEMKQLLIPISKIWYPDIFVNNLKHIEVPIPVEKNYAIIDYDGTIEISIMQLVTLHCKYNIIMFPFDIQNCTIWICSWMHTANQIDLWFTTPTDLTSYYNNSEWDLISMTARRKLQIYGAAEIAWVTVNYDIIMQRRPSYYLFAFVLPCFIITTISIIGVFTPFNDAGGREEKVTMALTTLLTMTVIVTLVAGQMPKSSEGLPLLGTYVMLQIGMAAATALLAVLVMYLNRKWTFGEPVPVWILKLTRLYHKKRSLPASNSKYGSSTTASATTSPGIGDSTNAIKQQAKRIKAVQISIKQLVKHVYEHRDEENLRKEWQIASQRLDLLLMILFLLLNCIFTVVFLIIGYANLRI